MPNVLEGSWEEIVAHAEELSGRHLRVIDLGPIKNGAAAQPTLETEEEKQRRLHAVARELIGRAVKGLPPDLSERAEELWGEGVEEEHWRQQSR